MICRSKTRIGLIRPIAKTTILLSVVFFFVFFCGEASAQRKFSRNYPAGQNIRLELTNRTGTVTVIGWDRSLINISADIEEPAAVISPQNLSGVIVINLLRDNPEREIGNVNFTIRLPYNSAIDIETRLGNLNVSNIRSALVRAHISSEGDITLTNIISNAVLAENGLGDIFFDGEIQEGGSYRFSSMRGNINIRIPFNSPFKFVATAPSTRNITVGFCANPNMGSVGDGRRIIGRCGDGTATMNVINQRGNIKFLPR